jgi:hypothetical protein
MLAHHCSVSPGVSPRVDGRCSFFLGIVSVFVGMNVMYGIQWIDVQFLRSSLCKTHKDGV